MYDGYALDLMDSHGERGRSDSHGIRTSEWALAAIVIHPEGTYACMCA